MNNRCTIASFRKGLEPFCNRHRVGIRYLAFCAATAYITGSLMLASAGYAVALYVLLAVLAIAAAYGLRRIIREVCGLGSGGYKGEQWRKGIDY